MRLSDEGAKFIMKEEGGAWLKAYKDQVGIWTIGVGHTGPEVGAGLTWTLAKATEVFKKDVERFEKAVTGAVKATLFHNQFDALLSFTFNVGVEGFVTSTLLKKLNKLDFNGAAEEFPRWNKADGKVLPVLVGRRARERALFLNGTY